MLQETFLKNYAQVHRAQRTVTPNVDLIKLIDKENLFMKLFLTASSFYSIFTQVPKTFKSTVALQVGFLIWNIWNVFFLTL